METDAQCMLLEVPRSVVLLRVGILPYRTLLLDFPLRLMTSPHTTQPSPFLALRSIPTTTVYPTTQG